MNEKNTEPISILSPHTLTEKVLLNGVIKISHINHRLKNALIPNLSNFQLKPMAIAQQRTEFPIKIGMLQNGQ